MVTFELARSPLEESGHLRRFHEWSFSDGTLWTEFFRMPQGYLLRFPSIGDYAVDKDGLHVTAWPKPGVSAAAIESIYLNQVLPLAWSRQGRMVFHGSAIELEGSAVAFIGRSGRGKSTLAASFAREDRKLFCDDSLLLAGGEGNFRVVPGHPSIRLWPDTEAAIFAEPLVSAAPVGYTTKMRFMKGRQLRFCEEERPLSAMFFLGRGDTDGIQIEQLRSSEAFAELSKHSFLIDTEERSLLANQFEALSQLAALPIHFRLDYPRDFGRLPDVQREVCARVSDIRGTA